MIRVARAVAAIARAGWLGAAFALGLTMLAACSCHGPQGLAGWGVLGRAGPPALPQSAYTGPPGTAGAGPGYSDLSGQPGPPRGIPLPYTPVGPWAPPGIRLPWPPDEYLADGGDAGGSAGLARDGRLLGLDPQDTIAHYTSPDGRTLVEPSNRVYLYSPRFGAVRQVVSLRENDQTERWSGVHQPEPLAGQGQLQVAASSKQHIQTARQVGQRSLTTFRTRQWDGVMSTALGPQGFQDGFLPFENLSAIRTGKSEQSELARLARGAAAAVAWSATQAVQVILDGQTATAAAQYEKSEMIFTVDQAPARPKLRLIKVASTPFAEPGQTVDFTIRFDNVGNQPIRSVTILDNLGARLEYVPGSAQASVPASFSAQRNETESLLLRWQITGPVEPGQGGILRFQCRVR